MNLYELERTEQNAAYQALAASNYARQYGFLLSVIQAAIASNKPWLSESLIKALNFHAIVGLHDQAGQYRSHQVYVGNYTPPERFRVASLMEDCVNFINWHLQSADPATLAAFALWKLNQIHPFVNGNGRTARAVCYFIICIKANGLLPGRTILPELLRIEPTRTEYVKALQDADSGDLGPLSALIVQVLESQLAESVSNS